MQSNALSGELPSKLSNLSLLQVLDLAENRLNGTIHATFGDLKAMAQVQKGNIYFLDGASTFIYYQESLVVDLKGQSLQYSKTLSFLTSIDLSGNNLHGDLPQELKKLAGLVVLNLSRNHISGQIPKNISNLHQLSSLDLSSNSLSGPIPPSMPSLLFLEFLNLSNNNFSGTIPYTGQMTTFQAPSYAGNPGLCSRPLAKCLGEGSEREGPPENMDSGKEVTDTWFYLSVGLGFAAGLLVPYFILTINEAWRNAYFAFIDEVAARFFGLRH